MILQPRYAGSNKVSLAHNHYNNDTTRADETLLQFANGRNLPCKAFYTNKDLYQQKIQNLGKNPKPFFRKKNRSFK